MVKIRLARRGRKKLAMYDVIVADARAPRDGRFIEKIGTYNPLTVPATIALNDDKAFKWLMNGAQPTDTVKAMLSYRGIMMKKHLQIGVIKGAITQEQADAKLAEWMTAKEAKIEAKLNKVTQTREASARERKAAETKIKEARAETIRKKAEAAAAAEEAAAPAVEAAAEGEVSEATVDTPAVEATETPVNETPGTEVAETPTPEAPEASEPAESETPAPETTEKK